LWQIWKWVQSNETLVGLLVGGSLALLIFSVALLPFVVNLIPADYFATRDGSAGIAGSIAFIR